MNRLVWKTPSAGAIQRLAITEEALPDLDSGKIRIQTKAIGLNFADIFALTGLYSATPQGAFIPGLEFCGIVLETGASAREFKPGDFVMGVSRFGAYASMIDADPIACRTLPVGWSFAQGAAYLAQTLTAWYAMKQLGDVRPELNVLVQSAAGGVGLQAMQICKRLGNFCVGTVGNPSKRDFLQEHGFTNIVVRGKTFSEDVRRALDGRELHLALDAVGGKSQKECYKLLAPTGRLIAFGAAEFAPGSNRPRYLKLIGQYLRRPLYDPLHLISENKSVMGFNLIWLWDRLEQMTPMLDQLQELNLDPPYVGKEFPFTQAPAAIEFLRSGNSIGKVVLIV